MNDNFFDLGAHSLTVAEVQAKLQEALSREIALVDFFEFSTVKALACSPCGKPSRSQLSDRAARRRLARIELKGRSYEIFRNCDHRNGGAFPGASQPRQSSGENLRDGVESIRDLSDAELLAAGAAPEELASPEYVKRASVLDDVPMFDASFFGFSPRDASIMDPQHRHFLECAWEALEDAGHPPKASTDRSASLPDRA